jgi:hypothetical protein
MDREGFGKLLETRKLSEEKISASILIAERFEEFLAASGKPPDEETAWQFSQVLIDEGQNTYDNFLALARYGLFIKNNDVYVAILELVDGAEAQPNLYKRVGELFGQAVRDEVFAGIGVSPIGLPTTEKPFDMFPVLDRLIAKVGYGAVEQLLSACLRDLPDEYFSDAREKYNKAIDIDAYLMDRHQSFVEELRKYQQEGRLFFAQEITDEVLTYVEAHPEFESGVREGNLLFITKIPYNTKKFLAETDPTMKRFYACHCPWARQAIKNGNLQLNSVFCNCSGGFSKKPWEVIYGQTLKVDLLESAIKGDYRCRFAVHLPEKLEIT